MGVSEGVLRKPLQRRWLYGGVGALLALGAPLGLLALRSMLAPGRLSFDALTSELTTEWITYAYVFLSTVVVFGLFGAVLGAKEDRTLEAAWTDPLTQVANRRYLNTRLADELARAKRYDTALSFLLIDVDRLKTINDEGGHDAGDRALVQVAQALRACSRETDTVARFGGDEFAWLAPFASLSDAVELGERVRRQLVDSASCVTVSVGVTDLGAVREPTAQAVYEAADEALYEAKRAGRDQVVESKRLSRVQAVGSGES